MFPHDFAYDSPRFIYLLFALLIFIVLFGMLKRYQKIALASFSQPSLKNLIISRSKTFFWMQSIGLCIAWTAATIALMQPKGHGRYPEEFQDAIQKKPVEQTASIRNQAHDVIFLLDASSSMKIADTRTQKTRFDYAKEMIDEITSHLRGENVSLSTFTSEVLPLVPSTLDSLYLRLILRQVQVNEGDMDGTDFLETLREVHDQMLSKYPQKIKTVIILSDGGDTLLESLQGQERHQRLDQILTLVKDARQFNFRIFTIGLGSTTPSPIPEITFNQSPVLSKLDDEILKGLSASTQGHYWMANDYTPLSLTTTLISELEENSASDQAHLATLSSGSHHQEDLIYDFYFQVPLAVAILFLWISLQLPMIRSSKPSQKKYGLISLWLFLCLIPFPLMADLHPSLREKAHLADGYFETQQFLLAQEEYERLLQEQLEPWEQAIIKVNISSCLVEQNQWGKAATQLSTTSLGPLPYPPLLRKSQFNLALSLFKRAENFNKHLQINSAPSMLISNLLLQSLKKALITLEAAKTTDCQISQLKGYSRCDPSADLLFLEKKINELLAEILAQQKVYLTAKSPQKLEENQEKSPLSILLNAIEKESQARELTAISLELVDDKELPLEIKTAINEMQKRTLLIVEPFIPTVKQLQLKLYESPSACLKKPWDEVLPLYQQGYTEAFNALQKMLFTTPDWDSIMQSQEKSISDWKAALEKLNAASLQEQKQPPKEELQKLNTNPSQKQILQLLEEMEKEDNIQHLTPPSPKKVLRPW